MIPADLPLDELAARMAAHDPVIDRHQGVLLTDADGKLAGILTRGDVVRALSQRATADRPRTVLDAAGATGDAVQVGFADETLHAVMGRLLRQGIGRFPVVAREDPRQIIGYLGRADILRARMRFYEEEEVRERFSRHLAPRGCHRTPRAREAV